MAEHDCRMAVWREQERIANCLHERVVPELFAISCGLCGLAGLGSSVEQHKRIDRAVADLDRAILEVREIVFNLSSQPAMAARRPAGPTRFERIGA